MFNERDLANALFRATGVQLSRKMVPNGIIEKLSDDSNDFFALQQYRNNLDKLLEKCMETQEPNIMSNIINCVWISMPIGNLVYVIGPALIGTVTKEQITKHFYMQGFSTPIVDNLVLEFMQIPVIPYRELLNYYSFIHNILYGKNANLNNFGFVHIENSRKKNKKTNDIYEVHELDYFTSKEVEYYIIDCVRNGDVERLKRRKKFTSRAVMGMIGLNELREYKNGIIVLISLISRAAYETGLSSEVVFPLSDMYIRQLEAMSNIAEVIALSDTALLHYAQLVKDNRFKLEFSKLINDCCGYIRSNFNKPLKLTDVSRFARMNPDALSRRFKKETGITVNSYILSVKIEESKMLLLHSELSLADIAATLAFSSQSLFTATFKKQTGKTPQSYRQEQRKILK